MASESIHNLSRLKIGWVEALASLLSNPACFSLDLVLRMTIRIFKLLRISSIAKSLENILHLTGGLALFILIFLILNKTLLIPVAVLPHFVYFALPPKN